MSQSLKQISREALRLQLGTINFGVLKRLHEEIFTYLKNRADKLPMSEIIDLERKQTMILKEMQSRGKLKADKDKIDYHNWLFQKKKKRVY